MTDFSKILDQAKELQNKIKQIEAIGISGANDVKITLNGEGEILKIKFSEKVFSEDPSVVEDLIKAAHNNARSQLKSKTTEEISKATGGIGIPGFKWPL